MRIPLPGKVLCVFAIGIVGWSATKGSVRGGASATNLSLSVASQTSNEPSLAKAASTFTILLSPMRGGVTLTHPLQLTASVRNDSSGSGVTWSSSGGILSNQTASSATFTATVAGAYTVTATSKADSTRSAMASVGVTDLVGVATWRNDRAHSGVN